MRYTEVVIGPIVATEQHYEMYEVWLQFDNGDAEPVMVEPSEILQKVNEWFAVMHLDGSEAQSVIGQADFSWPRHDGTKTFAALSGIDVYYYDETSRKHSVNFK